MARTPVAGYHVWEEWDTWWDVAAKYTGSGLNWYALALANRHVRNPNRVPAGTHIRIPRELLR